MTVGQKIRFARKKAKMTQNALAQKLNIPYQSIGQWERDIRKPKYETLQRIAEALEIDVSELVEPVPKKELLNFSLKTNENKYNRLQKIRDEKNLTRQELANRCHISEADIAAYEQGDASRLSNAMLFRISIALEVFPSDLYDPIEYLILGRDSLNNRFLVQADIVNVLSFLPQKTLNDIWALLWDVCHEHTELLSKCNWNFGITNEIASGCFERRQKKK